jgi:hypothetical protein
VDLICPICRVKRQKVIKFRNTFGAWFKRPDNSKICKVR